MRFFGMNANRIQFEWMKVVAVLFNIFSLSLCIGLSLYYRRPVFGSIYLKPKNCVEPIWIRGNEDTNHSDSMQIISICWMFYDICTMYNVQLLVLGLTHHAISLSCSFISCVYLIKLKIWYEHSPSIKMLYWIYSGIKKNIILSC